MPRTSNCRRSARWATTTRRCAIEIAGPTWRSRCRGAWSAGVVGGGLDGTQLTCEPAQPAGAPSTLALGQIVQFEAPGPFTVASQDDMHPFYMSAHMTGCETYTADQSDCRGD